MSTPETFVPFMPQGEATTESVVGTLLGAVELLGPDGENWIQGELRGPGATFCMVGALEQAAPDYQSYAAARDALKETLGSGNLDRFNNGATFPEVREALQNTAGLLLFGSATLEGKSGFPAHI